MWESMCWNDSKDGMMWLASGFHDKTKALGFVLGIGVKYPPYGNLIVLPGASLDAWPK